MINAKAIISIKGGPTSGHYDHAGRPGKVGGSQPKNGKGDEKPSIFIDSYDEVKSSKYGGKGYFITGDDRLVDVISDFGPGSNDHVGAFVAMEHPEIVGLTKEDAKEFERLYIEGDTELMKYWDKIHKSGVIRVREFGKKVYIDTYEMNKSTLRRIQRLMDDGKIRFYPGKENVWVSSDNYWSDVRFTYADIIDADDVDIDGAKLKECAIIAKLKLKGGEGSGNFAHAGRPGKVGGSAAGTGGVRKGKVTKDSVLNMFQGTNIERVEKHPFKSSGVAVFKLTNNADVAMWRRLSNMGFTKKRIGSGMFAKTDRLWTHPKSSIVVEFVRGKERGVKYVRISSISKLRQSAGDTLAGQLGALLMAESKKEYKIMAKLKVKVEKGGPGSGHHGHAGRPGSVGGSAPGKGGKGKGKGGSHPFERRINRIMSEGEPTDPLDKILAHGDKYKGGEIQFYRAGDDIKVEVYGADGKEIGASKFSDTEEGRSLARDWARGKIRKSNKKLAAYPDFKKSGTKVGKFTLEAPKKVKTISGDTTKQIGRFTNKEGLTKIIKVTQFHGKKGKVLVEYSGAKGALRKTFTGMSDAVWESVSDWSKSLK